MREIVTRYDVYPVETVGGREAIRATKGDHKGELYAILGCYDPMQHEFRVSSRALLFDGRAVGYDDLVGLLDLPRVGTRVVGRLVNATGAFDETKQLRDIMRTSRIREIRE